MATMTSGLGSSALLHRMDAAFLLLQTQLIELRNLWVAQDQRPKHDVVVETGKPHVFKTPIEKAAFALFENFETHFVKDGLIHERLKSWNDNKTLKIWCGIYTNGSKHAHLAWSEVTFDLGVFFVKFDIRANSHKLIIKC